MKKKTNDAIPKVAEQHNAVKGSRITGALVLDPLSADMRVEDVSPYMRRKAAAALFQKIEELGMIKYSIRDGVLYAEILACSLA